MGQVSQAGGPHKLTLKGYRIAGSVGGRVRSQTGTSVGNKQWRTPVCVGDGGGVLASASRLPGSSWRRQSNPDLGESCRETAFPSPLPTIMFPFSEFSVDHSKVMLGLKQRPPEPPVRDRRC